MHALGTAKGKPRGKGKVKITDGTSCGQEFGQEQQGRNWQKDTDYFPSKCHGCGEERHKAVHCSKEEGKGREKKKVYGVGDGEADETGVEAAQNLGEIEVCAV